MEDGDKLYRNYDVFYNLSESFRVTPSIGPPGTLPYDYKTLIAEHISSISFSPAGDVYELTVTASVEGIAGIQEETRVYEAKPRPNIY